MPSGDVIVALRGVEIDYRGLRPLRVNSLELRQGQSIALIGFDQAAAHVLVDLITAAAVPDSGDVDTFGRSTRSISDADTWLRDLDQFGILSERMVLLDQLTVEQNVAMAYSLDVEDLSPEVRVRIASLAREVGIEESVLSRPLVRIDAAARARIRLAKAIALKPRVLLAEHPNAMLPADDVAAFAADLSRVVSQRRLATLVLTADRTFAAAVAEVVLTLQPATGDLKAGAGWRSWFG